MSKRLLAVDGEANLLRAVAAVSRGEGFEVLTARSGRAAFIAVSQSLPDLIVSDVRMPGMDGFVLARKQRSAPKFAPAPKNSLTA